jgi:RNA exonuclease 4
MAVYRVRRKEWEKGSKPPDSAGRKRKRSTSEVGGQEESSEEVNGVSVFSGGGRRGVSSGLSTVVRGGKQKWWKDLSANI